MSGMRHSIVVDLAGNLSRQARAFSGSMETFSRRGARSMRMLSRATAAAGRGLDRLGNRYTALATGAAGAGTLRALVQLESRMTRLGVQAGRSADEIKTLKNRIFEAAQAPDIRVDPGQIIAAIEKIIEKTGDLGLAESNIRNIGLAIQATGARGMDIGAMIADMKEKFEVTTEKEFLQTLDAVITQGKTGAFTLQKLATQGERVTSAYGQFNRVGPQAVKEMGAMLQMVKRGVGPAEQAATAMEALVRTFNDAKKRKLLESKGIQIVDPEDPERLRSIVEIVKDIVRATDGDYTKLSAVFDSEALRAFTGAVSEFKKTGGFASLDKFMSVDGSGADLLADSATNAQTAAAALQSLQTAFQKFADANLTKPLRDIADAFNSMSPEQVDKIMKALGYGAAAAGGLILVSKGIRTAAAAKSLFGRGKGGGLGTALGGAAGAAGAMPVMVMNWPAGGVMGGADGGKRGRRAKRGARVRGRGVGGLAARGGQALAKLGGGKLSSLFGSLSGNRVASLAKGGGRALSKAFGGLALPLTALFYGMDAVGAAKAGDAKGVGGAVGGLGGTAGGAAAGAMIGSVVPVLGTAIGGIIGAILGSLGGEKLGELVGGQFDDKRSQDIGGKLAIEIKSDQPVTVRRLEKNSNAFDYDVDAGIAMVGP